MMENAQNQLPSFNNNSIIKQSDNQTAKNQQKSSFAGKFVSIITAVIKFIFFPFILIFKATKSLINYCTSKKNNTDINNNKVANLQNGDTASNIVQHGNVKQANQLDNKYQQNKLYSDFINASLALKPHLEITDKVLGTGGYGEVKLAKLHDPSTKEYKYVAVKTYLKNPPENNNPKTHKDFVREVSIGLATKEDSDNFTSIIAAFEQSGTENFKIVMELGDLTLKNAYDFFMENKKLPTDIIGYITCTFIHSLQQCIINNISRKDASVTNFLLFFNQNKIKSSDFGEDSLQENITFNAALGMTTKVCRIIEETLDTYLTEDIDLDKKYDLNEKQEIVKTYFMPEINKTSLTQQQKDKIENLLIHRSRDLIHTLQNMYSMLNNFDTTNLDTDTKMNLLMRLLDANKKFIMGTIGYRETFIADVKKLYEAKQS